MKPDLQFCRASRQYTAGRTVCEGAARAPREPPHPLGTDEVFLCLRAVAARLWSCGSGRFTQSKYLQPSAASSRRHGESC